MLHSRRRLSVVLLAISLVAAAVGTSCTAAQGSAEDAAPSTPSADTQASTPSATEATFEPFDASTFTNSSEVTNNFLPLLPGTRFTYEGETVEDDGKVVPHRVVINVTDLTKVIGGVRSVVTWDLDYSDGELVEAELAFLAQDKDGSVWRMGEYPEEYDEGKFVLAPAWIHGVDDARAGIMMKANPLPNTPSYSQGWGPKVGWTDRGKVDQVSQGTTVRAGSYANVLVISETSASEGNAEQLKYYAPGVGNVKVGWRGSQEKTKETLELVKVERLDAKALAEVRASAMKMEKDAYTRSKAVYGQTTPLEPRPASAPATR